MKRIVGMGMAVAALALVTGCQDGATTPKPAGTPTTTVGAPGGVQPTGAEQAPVVTKPAGDGTPATAGGGKCVDLKSPVVTAALGKLGANVGGEGFSAQSGTEAKVGSCPALMWVLADTPHGTASSPWHVMLFNQAGYLGTATKKSTSYTSVVGSSDRSVQVQYRWLAGSDPSCCPSGGPVVVTLMLGADGHTVTPDRDFPTEVTNPK
ncbi:LppP/LprE family lipoprotein [Nocardia sp. NPDC004151]|uniref:LppP/LprE family lipoprotein n=1 Tax=Nocardia sp. NPDC004151 TaxID=3364304 RepID=UPI0036C87665